MCEHRIRESSSIYLEFDVAQRHMTRDTKTVKYHYANTVRDASTRKNSAILSNIRTLHLVEC